MTKKQWIYGGVGVTALGVVLYLLLKENENTLQTNTLPNGINVNADKDSAYYKSILAFSNDKNKRLALVRQLLQLLSAWNVDNQAVMRLISENLPDDEYMKIFRHTFYFHKYTKALIKSDQEWDLKGWLENRLSASNFEILKSRYPSLNTSLKKVKK